MSAIVLFKKITKRYELIKLIKMVYFIKSMNVRAFVNGFCIFTGNKFLIKCLRSDKIVRTLAESSSFVQSMSFQIIQYVLSLLQKKTRIIPEPRCPTMYKCLHGKVMSNFMSLRLHRKLNRL